MEKEKLNKIRPVKILEILRKYSDEVAPISTSFILKKLKEEGIDCARQTVYKDIKLLQEFGYEIFCQRKTVNEYYIADRLFNEPEIRILIDAVQAANFITPAKTEELVNRLAWLTGMGKAEILKNNIVQFNTTKHTNEAIYYNVNEIGHAITANKRVSFLYFDYNEKKEKVYRKEGRPYYVNPVATVYADDKYYLITYYEKYGNIVHYRIDRMEHVEVCKEDIPAEALDEIDVQRHKKGLFNMFTGEETTVEFEAGADTIDSILDRFGENVELIKTPDGNIRFKADVQISPRFFSWCCTNNSKLKIIGPEKVVDDFKLFLTDLLKSYET